MGLAEAHDRVDPLPARESTNPGNASQPTVARRDEARRGEAGGGGGGAHVYHSSSQAPNGKW